MSIEVSYITFVRKLVKLLPELKKKVLSPKQNSLNNFFLGEIGEKTATNYLINLGYQILSCNVVFKKYEIDIVALDPKTDELVFVEVKTRKSKNFGHPSKAVHRVKLRSMKIGAELFLRYTDLQNFYRFDIITITPGRVEHFKNITWP